MFMPTVKRKRERGRKKKMNKNDSSQAHSNEWMNILQIFYLDLVAHSVHSDWFLRIANLACRYFHDFDSNCYYDALVQTVAYCYSCFCRCHCYCFPVICVFHKISTINSHSLHDHIHFGWKLPGCTCRDFDDSNCRHDVNSVSCFLQSYCDDSACYLVTLAQL